MHSNDSTAVSGNKPALSAFERAETIELHQNRALTLLHAMVASPDDTGIWSLTDSLRTDQLKIIAESIHALYDAVNAANPSFDAVEAIELHHARSLSLIHSMIGSPGDTGVWSLTDNLRAAHIGIIVESVNVLATAGSES